MKKIYIFITVLTVTAFLQANAQTKVNVTFAVDMSTHTGAISDSGVHIAGNFTTHGSSTINDWDPADPDAKATLIPTTAIYTVTTDLTAGDTLLYKFVNGNAWSVPGTEIEGHAGNINATCGADDGNGGFNRLLVVPNFNAVVAMQWEMCAAAPVALSVKNENVVKPYFDIYPNPSVNTSTISYSVGTKDVVRVEVYNALGQLMNSDAAMQTPGSYTNTINTSNFATGVYFVKLSVGNNFNVAKLNVVK